MENIIKLQEEFDALIELFMTAKSQEERDDLEKAIEEVKEKIIKEAEEVSNAR